MLSGCGRSTTGALPVSPSTMSGGKPSKPLGCRSRRCRGRNVETLRQLFSRAGGRAARTRRLCTSWQARHEGGQQDDEPDPVNVVGGSRRHRRDRRHVGGPSPPGEECSIHRTICVRCRYGAAASRDRAHRRRIPTTSGVAVRSRSGAADVDGCRAHLAGVVAHRAGGHSGRARCRPVRAGLLHVAAGRTWCSAAATRLSRLGCGSSAHNVSAIWSMRS